MKKMKIGLLFIALLTFGFSMNSCNNASSAEKENMESSETSSDAEEASMESSGEAADSGPEYTSAYVCPMHCEGSGSAEAGKCPSCGMDYVMNEDMEKEEMEEAEEEKPDQDGHECHNHG
jgi:hypothetical protein